MPPRTPKACRVRGCRSTTTDPSGYCEKHKGEGWKSYKPGQSRQQRGYGTKWEVIGAGDRLHPLSEKTLERRRAEGIPGEKPLYAHGYLLRSINYVVRKK